ncbi:aromatic acid exporter family protein [Bacillus tuaregi]|uniref:aromatic acid exporter family protein n=1 Tax=Bacillus tuaregi TaxID=1816695 RepID=UPI0008F88A5C|nr:aromatic acid exporter family protein [Bacillus tuaregi]
MRFRIGYRTIKSAVGATVSIMLAQYLGFENFVSAGIITILCIQITKKKSLRASWDRILACIIAIMFSSVFFEVIAYHPFVIGILLLFFIPTVVMLKASEGIVSSTVIILHFFAAGDVTLTFIFNELAIIFIGVGVALFANLYMPSLDTQIEEYQERIEANFRSIFLEISKYLRVGDSNWDGKEITETIDLINHAKKLSFRVMENQFIHNEEDDLYYTYFKIREKQFEIIERVLPIVTSISHTVEQGKMIADFIEEMAGHIHPGNTANFFLDKLEEMHKAFENMELPKTRKEFEVRAALLYFVKEMEQYLLIKRDFKGIKKQKVVYDKQLGEGN